MSTRPVKATSNMIVPVFDRKIQMSDHRSNDVSSSPSVNPPFFSAFLLFPKPLPVLPYPYADSWFHVFPPAILVALFASDVCAVPPAASLPKHISLSLLFFFVDAFP